MLDFPRGDSLAQAGVSRLGGLRGLRGLSGSALLAPSALWATSAPSAPWTARLRSVGSVGLPCVVLQPTAGAIKHRKPHSGIFVLL